MLILQPSSGMRSSGAGGYFSCDRLQLGLDDGEHAGFLARNVHQILDALEHSRIRLRPCSISRPVNDTGRNSRMASTCRSGQRIPALVRRDSLRIKTLQRSTFFVSTQRQQLDPGSSRVLLLR